jgi:hypothetical protein
VQLSAKPAAVAFRAPEIGKTQTATILLAARHSAMDVFDIVVGDAAQFSVSPTRFRLENGQSQSVTITYTPRNENAAFCQFTPQSDVCRSSSFYAAAQSLNEESDLQNFRLLSPNGGEIFLAGGDTTITWTGTLPQERAILEYSVNGGKAWRRTGKVGKNHAATWKVPKVSTGEALVRGREISRWAQARTLEGLSGEIVSLVSRPGGSVVGVSKDGSARVWESEDGEEQQALRVEGGSVRSVVWNPNHKNALVVFANGGARIWSPEQSGNDSAPRWEALPSPVVAADWSADGARVALGLENGSALLADASDGKILRTIKAHKGATTCLAWSPDGVHIATGGADKIIFVWNARTGARAARWEFHRDTVLCLAWRHSGDYLLSCAAGATHNAAVWHIHSETPLYALGAYDEQEKRGTVIKPPCAAHCGCSTASMPLRAETTALWRAGRYFLRWSGRLPKKCNERYSAMANRRATNRLCATSKASTARRPRFFP